MQTGESWADFIEKPQEEIRFSCNNAEIYFEDDKIEKIAEKLEKFDNIEYIYPLKEHTWEQRGRRFYDTDKHIYRSRWEQVAVYKRLLKNGISTDKTAKITSNHQLL